MHWDFLLQVLCCRCVYYYYWYIYWYIRIQLRSCVKVEAAICERKATFVEGPHRSRRRTLIGYANVFSTMPLENCYNCVICRKGMRLACK